MFYFKVTIGFMLSLAYQMPKAFLGQLTEQKKQNGVGQKFIISNFHEGGGRNGKVKDRKAKV